ncbi:lipoprotein insertase outer membrane protein LolB [Aquisalimonas sp.]|uniref:lipoprotein insertase outer membrane protein LolB n=1 Tax=unclassified Aquisalimonas TaxID=2644645 RepID=UPI0025BE7272|nr:lipoprotein insertase outer membrane protein LolB [Aquisalimonas sp.]
MRSLRRLVIPLTTVVIAGCAAVPERDHDAREALLEERTERLEAVSVWQASGRAGITTPDDRASLSMDWRQAGEAYRLDLRAPMGAGSFRLQGDDQGVVLQTSDGVTDSAADPSELLFRYTGFDLPVAVLPWWLRGVPAPGMDVASMELDRHGRIERMEQAGWTIEYTAYDTVGSLDLPVRLSLEGEGVSLRAHIRDWDTGGSDI